MAFQISVALCNYVNEWRRIIVRLWYHYVAFFRVFLFGWGKYIASAVWTAAAFLLVNPVSSKDWLIQNQKCGVGNIYLPPVFWLWDSDTNRNLIHSLQCMITLPGVWITNWSAWARGWRAAITFTLSTKLKRIPVSSSIKEILLKGCGERGKL